MSSPRPTKVTPLSGFPEYLPEQRIVEQHFLDVIRATFELHGFPSIETRAVEPVERLLGRGGDADKEIYGIHRLAGDEGGAAESDLGLHFDLTVPFARYVVEHAGRLDFPFRRHQIQKVWRGERPQEGRYREFTQCDIDVVDVGELAPHFEAAVHSLKGSRHVIDCRNLGLMGAIELAPREGAPTARAFEVFLKCYEQGVLIRTTGDIIALTPSLIVEKAEIDRMVGTIAEVLKTIE